ncbi:sigma-70 family RNA polymerase sigma factor [Cupriavidus basilensis]|uniref:Sigma-70 family RNA polymerase sigma factor n=1 Tax=Cupriavidus basilensis TaxID=68895 RepID=A0ABT6AV50_9BURK|nr:sigma-70 family RNA polymerase sigma factor [Cupriavidus basilensis]MDF3836470.1 sigma-70 family RNA polymerase sigma factor [Cupriavidus basilensis]
MPPEPDSHNLLATLVRHYEDLVEHVRRRFAARGFARDVVHDLCVQLLERPPRATARQPLAFLRRASLYRAIDRHRAEAAHANVVVSVDEVADLRSHEADGAQQLHLAQQVQSLRMAIENLPPRCRLVFLLHRLHDMPQEEVARELGISRNMVARHLARAMQSLRPLLDPDPRPPAPFVVPQQPAAIAAPTIVRPADGSAA